MRIIVPQPDARRAKKDLGAFYTHQALSDLICRWVIQSPSESVLEPSFGGCGFIRSVRDRLNSMRENASLSKLYGCDIDQSAFAHLSEIFEQPVDLCRFHDGDFLAQDFPKSWPREFDVVVGNPPYLAYQKLDTQRREAVLSQLKTAGLNLDRRASLWAYFVALSVLYTAKGGRNAWVLPSSFLYANYSKALRVFLSHSFARCCAFELKERQFLLEGTEEKSIVLLCEGRKSLTNDSRFNDIPLVRCDGVKDVELAIKSWSLHLPRRSAHCGSSVFDSLSAGQKRIYQRIEANPNARSLGDYLSVRIGLVTGNNRFFLLNEEGRLKAALSKDELCEVLPRFQFASGVSFSIGDHDALISAGGKGYLVSVSDSAASSTEMQNYLAMYSDEDIASCSTFRKRAIWSNIEDGSPPDAFLPVMQHHGPRLVLNLSGANCTNSVYRAYFTDNTSLAERKLLSLSLLSTFSQVSSEMCGRSYGSGALKHEPREAERIKVLMPRIGQRAVNLAFSHVDRILRGGNLVEARHYVDRMLLKALGGIDVGSTAAILDSSLQKMKAHRHR